MGFYSEFECAFICRQFSIDSYQNVCDFLQRRGFALNKQSPGYIFGVEFKYPDWSTIEEAIEQIKKDNCKLFCINFYHLENDTETSCRLSLEAEIDNNCVSLQVGEESFIDTSAQKIDRCKLMEFIRLSEELAPFLDIKAWKIAPTGFDHDAMNIAHFKGYKLNDNYPINDINDLITWYEEEYLLRWHEK